MLLIKRFDVTNIIKKMKKKENLCFCFPKPFSMSDLF